MQEPHDAGGIRQLRVKGRGRYGVSGKGQDSRGEVGMGKLGGRAKTSDVSTRQVSRQPHVALALRRIMPE
jgi:hypothetical protein